ncbi:MAG TPA: signal peptidase I [Candidatus Merdivicinus faecavium]|nr:signal peptidase I [Candidatus Merdivicinus faecavium]
MKKAAKIIYNTVTTLFVIVAVGLAALLVGVRLFGLTPYSVLSGSMEPTYHVGSLIYVEKVDPSEIEVGDPITFVLNEDLVVATHRVVAIDAENEHFYTKGDANDAQDAAPVYFKNLLGRPVFTIPYLGYAADFLSSRQGMIVGICGFIILMLLMFFPDIMRAVDGKDKKKDSQTEPEVKQ